jgi:hypothetical protein
MRLIRVSAALSVDPYSGQETGNRSEILLRGAVRPRETVMFTRDRLVAVVAALAIGGGIAGQAQAAAPNDPGIVLQWNQLMEATIPASVGPLQFRHYAIMNIAMFDAVNSIERSHKPFHARVAAASGGSTEAAAAQAAHDVLVALIPGDGPKAMYDAALAIQLAAIEPGRRSQGVAVGKAAAKATLAWRANDGASLPPVPYQLPLIAGMWQPTTPGAPAGLTQLPRMTPFTMLTPTQFLPTRFPELTSDAYTEDFNEVKDIGSVNSAVRTPEQTQIAQLFAGIISSTNITFLWHHVVRDITLSQHLSLIESARAFALVFAVATDSLMTSQTSKFVYGLWRPQTAVRHANDDLNDLTLQDAAWASLLPTPPYPTYAGNMACIGAGAAQVLANLLGGNAIGFSVTWTGAGGNPDVTRHYAGFWQLAQEQADSRIYGGIHFRFDNEASQAACSKVADHAFQTRTQPLRQ